MSKEFYKVIFVTTILFLIISAVTLIMYRPTPSDEEIPRGSRRVEIENKIEVIEIC